MQTDLDSGLWRDGADGPRRTLPDGSVQLADAALKALEELMAEYQVAVSVLDREFGGDWAERYSRMVELVNQIRGTKKANNDGA